MPQARPRRAVSGAAAEVEGVEGRACGPWGGHRLAVARSVRPPLRRPGGAGDDDPDRPTGETGVTVRGVRLAVPESLPHRRLPSASEPAPLPFEREDTTARPSGRAVHSSSPCPAGRTARTIAAAESRPNRRCNRRTTG